MVLVITLSIAFLGIVVESYGSALTMALTDTMAPTFLYIKKEKEVIQ